MMGVNRWVHFSAEFTEFWNTVDFLAGMTVGVVLFFMMKMSQEILQGGFHMSFQEDDG